MKTIKHTLNQLIVIALVLMLSLTTVFPVFAASGENLTITIHNNTGLPAMKTDQFSVYQLFTGTPNWEGEITEENKSSAKEWGAANWNNYTLANVQWGESINDSSALVEALNGLKQESAKWAYDEVIVNGESTGEFVNAFAGVKDAADLAKVLENHKSNAFLQKFSDFLFDGKYLKALENKSLKPNLLSDNNNHNNDTLTLTVPSSGYYLLAETGISSRETDDAVSEYILSVLGNQDIYLKASIPTVDKNIVSGDKRLKGDAAGISDTVTFELKGNLAKNFMDFETYYYKFTDILSKGLTFNMSSVVVTVKQDEKTYTINPSEYGIIPNGSIDGNVLPGEDGTPVLIAFSNLRKTEGIAYKSVSPDSSGAGTLVLNANAEIYVTYSATINANAVIGSAGNPNDVNLTYSNDPNSDGKGKTENKRVYVYAFGLDLTKNGSDADHDDEGLPGAGFILKNSEGKYAKFENAVDSKSKDIRRLVNWVEASTVDNLINEYKTAKEAYNNASNSDKSAKKEALDAAAKALESYLLTSGEKGKIPDVTGLDEGKYTLTEIITPDGYNTMDPFWFKIVPTFAKSGELESVIYAPMKGQFKTYTSTQGAVFSSGLMPQTLTNIKAPFLPFTGGIGTTIFYILGVVLIAGAAIYLVISIKKRNKKEDNI